jgi:hypothetical protein
MLGVRHLDDSKPVPVDVAVDRYRASQPSAPASAGPSAAPSATATAAAATATPVPGASATARPGATGGPSGAPSARPSLPPARGVRTPPGVYVYATTGYETADAGVPQARHDYPRETATTVREVGCGVSVRWDATEDRWDDVTICHAAENVTKVAAYVSYHRFFGQSETRSFTCSGDSYLRPPSGVGHWQFDCTAPGALARTVGTVIGVETVNGARALHVHYETALTGTNRGENPQDFWLAVDGPYVLRQRSRVDAEVDTPWGTITYHEQYDLVLKSRTPRR